MARKGDVAAPRRRAVNGEAPARKSHGEVAVAIAIGCCVVAVAYASMRVLQAWRYPDPDPRLVLVTSRVAFYWRSLLALQRRGILWG